MTCRLCSKETNAVDGFCRGCRMIASTRERQKYFWTPELDAKLCRAYQAKTKRLVGAQIVEMMRITGWPRCIFQNRAQLLGLRIYTSERWEPTEIEAIQELAGTLPMYKIAKLLGRSELAVRNKLFRLNIEGRLTEGFSVNELCKLFGTPHAKIERWIGHAWLSVNDDDRVTHASVKRFVWEHMDEYRFAACEEWWLKTMLKPPSTSKILGITRPSAERRVAA